MQEFTLKRLGPADEGTIMRGAELFDSAPHIEWATAFLAQHNHLMVWATVGDQDAGFISGMLITHPDKGVEVLLYELGVEPQFRRLGIARALVEDLAAWGRENGCSGMWVPVDHDNDVAQSFYRATGADEPDRVLTYWWSFNG